MGRVTDKQVEEWVERYNLGLAGHEARVAFEDAQSTDVDPLLAPSPVEDNGENVTTESEG